MNEVRQFRHIKQKFNHPIINSYGNWSERESLVLFTQLNDGAAFVRSTDTVFCLWIWKMREERH